MSWRSYILFFLTFIFLFSCEKEWEVDKEERKKLVVNAILSANDTIRVQLSKARNVFNPNDKIDWIRNAEVNIYKSDGKIQYPLNYKKEGVYCADIVAEAGENYELEVIHPEYKDIIAQAKVPHQKVAILKHLGSDNNKDIFDLEIPDQKANEYYMWEMFAEKTNTTKYFRIKSTDRRVDNILSENASNQSRIFFKGCVNKNLDSCNSIKFEAENDGNHTAPKVRLITMNLDMYKYYKSLELYRNSKNKYVRPIEIYSNIDEGLGIFGAINQSIIAVSR